MTPVQILDNEDVVNQVADIYMAWPKRELISEILEYMSVDDLNKIAQDFQVDVKQ
jgi:hypothetical protein